MKPIKQLLNMSDLEKATNADTLVHIHNVQFFLTLAVKDLLDRMQNHDRSKLGDPELSTFVEYGPKLKDTIYGSDEYKEFLSKMGPSLEHHYKNNKGHHIEGNENGMNDMSFTDAIEMLMDWKASSLRSKGGSLLKSIDIQRERYNFDDLTYNMFINTAQQLGILND